MSTKKAIGDSFAAIFILLISQLIAQGIAAAFGLIKVPSGVCNIIAGALYAGLAYAFLKIFAAKIVKLPMAELGMPVFLIGIYYTLHAGFGVQSVYADIGLYYLTLGLGFAAALRVNRSGRLGWLAGVLVILTGLYGAALILFTLAPPEFPIFMAVS